MENLEIFLDLKCSELEIINTNNDNIVSAINSYYKYIILEQEKSSLIEKKVS